MLLKCSLLLWVLLVLVLLATVIEYLLAGRSAVLFEHLQLLVVVVLVRLAVGDA